MYLKSLTLRGFKSFASSTTLNFEKGITAVVGPNGSGKSNVVDAIAWVLGEQGAKALRGGKMEDVIFAGTADRPPLGRAEVTLTIDNADGALPIDYSEVSITRRMFRDGGGEYEINGSSCRLLDIQELLSDSGIGREMHVIVGQGQLDAVLQARPEDRRAFIEEAAGVLKHRKRKEKALRKLDAMQANLTRLTDLTGELRRQLKPLGRQAEVARRAAGVQSELRDSKARLLADDLAALATTMERETRDEAAAVEHRERLSAAMAQAAEAEQTATAIVAAATPEFVAAQDIWFALSRLSERFRGTVSLADERRRNLSTPLEAPRSGRDPDELEAAAERADAEQAEKVAVVEAAREVLAEAVAGRTEAENRLRAADAAVVATTRAIADRREGLARLSGQVNTARSRLAASDDEVERLSVAAVEARERAAAAEQEFRELRESVGDLDTSEIDLDEAHEAAAETVESARGQVRALRVSIADAEKLQTGLRSRIDALSLGLSPKDGAAALLAGSLVPVLGSVATLVEIEPGFEAAVAGALGQLADGVAVADTATAVQAMTELQSADGGRVSLLTASSSPAAAPGGPLPEGARWARALVRGPAALAGSLDWALRDVVVVDGLVAAQELMEARPGLTAVTKAGDVLATHRAVGGSAAGQSSLEIQAALDAAEHELATATGSISRLNADLDIALQTLTAGEAEEQRTLAALHDSDARMAAVTEQLGRLGQAARSAGAESERLERQRQAADTARDQHRKSVDDLEERLAGAEVDDLPDEVDTSERDEFAELAEESRQAEMESRLSLRTAEERARATAGSAESLRRAATAERQAREQARIAAQRRAAGSELAGRVSDLATRAAARLEQSLIEAGEARDTAGARRAGADAALAQARARAAELQKDWDRLTDAVHRDEVVRAQQTLRWQQLSDRSAAEFALVPDDLIAEFGPDVPVPPSAADMAEFETARERGESVIAPAPVPFDRETQERRARRADKDLAVLGKVNPLALEEFAALEERHAFLSTQLDDIKSTRRDLMTVVKEVDEKILEVFTAAYYDVAREFVGVFAALFPGGEGELVLTDPSDMLTTGIEVNARPPGKKVKRLSLLSGGERSLTAVAMLVAIFRARPSPFYIMDEVEAALDEVNLERLVGLLTQLRDSSQLIIITHQKYTMESADALYGVSMRGDGITQVISQRIRDADRSPALAGVAAQAAADQ